MMPARLPHFRIEVPRPRSALLGRAVVAGLFSFLLGGLAWRSASPASAAVALLGTLLFAGLGLQSWRRSRSRRAPLVIDERGLTIASEGRLLEIAWSDLRSVRLRRGLLRRRVVLTLRGDPVRELVLPGLCQGDVPAEWWAGAIEVLRRRARHG